MFQKEDDHKGKLAVADWLFRTCQCLRFGMTKFIDGVGQKCSDKPNSRHCSWCRGHSSSSSPSRQIPDKPKATTSSTVLGKRPAHKVVSSFTEAYTSSKRRREDRRMGQGAYIDQFKAALSKFSGICAFCRVHGHIKPYHSILTCDTMVMDPSLETDRDTYRHWKGQLRYNELLHGKVCYFCHVPQCHDLLHETFMSSAGSCKHPDVVGGVAYGLFHHTTLHSDAEEHFSQHWATEDQFVQWLNKAPVTGHKTNMTALFLWYSSTI